MGQYCLVVILLVQIGHIQSSLSLDLELDELLNDAMVFQCERLDSALQLGSDEVGGFLEHILLEVFYLIHTAKLDSFHIGVKVGHDFLRHICLDRLLELATAARNHAHDTPHHRTIITIHAILECVLSRLSASHF